MMLLASRSLDGRLDVKSVSIRSSRGRGQLFSQPPCIAYWNCWSMRDNNTLAKLWQCL